MHGICVRLVARGIVGADHFAEIFTPAQMLHFFAQVGPFFIADNHIEQATFTHAL